MRISDWSSDVCSSDLDIVGLDRRADRDGGLLLLDGRFDRRAKSRQRAMNARDQIWEIGQADAVVRYMRRDNIGGEREQHILGVFGHHDFLFCLCPRSEEHTSELQSLMRISYAVFCLKKK